MPDVVFDTAGAVHRYADTWEGWAAHHAAVLDILRPRVVRLCGPVPVAPCGGAGDGTYYGFRGRPEFGAVFHHDKAYVRPDELVLELLRAAWPGVHFEWEGG